MTRKTTSPRKPTATPRRSRAKPQPGWPAWSCWLVLIVLGAASFGAGHQLGQRREITPTLPTHVTIRNYAQLLASEVCPRIEEQIAACEEAGKPFTGEMALKIFRDHGEEARQAAWQPTLDLYTDLQNSDGEIDYDKARKANQQAREGFEAVR